MGRKRLVVVVAAAAPALLFGTGSALAGHPVLAVPPISLGLGPVEESGLGFALAPNGAAPVGSHLLITIPLLNRAARFGKPQGAQVGRVLIDCTVLTKTRAGDCTGLTRLPGGYFTVRVPDRALSFGPTGSFDRVRVHPVDLPLLEGVGSFAGMKGKLAFESPTVAYLSVEPA
jgi:hypothetical protein